jgi:outer membrane protein TolC
MHNEFWEQQRKLSIVFIFLLINGTGLCTSTAQAQPAPTGATLVRPSAPNTPRVVIKAKALTPSEAAVARGEVPVPRYRQRYTLQESLELALRNHPNLMASKARLAVMRAQLQEAYTAPYSGFSVTAGAGPAPTFRGSAVYTQDKEVGLGSSIGLAWRFDFNGTIPIWTFGKITNLWAAAKAQIEVGKADVETSRNEVRMDVRKAYFGLQLARDSLNLLKEARSKIADAISSMEKKLAEDDEDVDIDSLTRLKLAKIDIESRWQTALRYEAAALSGLRFLTGVGSSYDILDRPLEEPKHRLQPMRTYLEAARSNRPEIHKARAGMDARRAQVALARARLMPDLGISLFANYSRAPEISDQTNPFVYDPANYFRFGFAFGLRWTLDLLPGAARVKQAEFQMEETRQLYRYALGGVGVEVETAYAQVIEARKRVELYREASKLARQWMVRVGQAIEVGTMDEKALIEPAREYATQKYNYLSALHDYNIAMATLTLKTGWNKILEPKR